MSISLRAIGRCTRFAVVAAFSFAGVLATSEAQAVLYAQIDIGGENTRTEPGFLSLPGAPTVTGTTTNGVNYVTTGLVSNTLDPFTVAINNVNQLGVAVGGVDWRDRGDDATPVTLSLVGEDFIKNNSGVIRVTLGSLPAGTYNAQAWHADADNTQSGIIDVFVDSGAGFVLTGTPGNSNFAFGGVNGANFNTATIDASSSFFSFTSNGINDVILVFNGTRFTADAETPLNGLRLVMVDVIPEPSTAMLGLLALAGIGARRNRRQA